MTITWAGAVHNVSNCFLRQVDMLLLDHLSDQLGSQQDWNRMVWSVWVLVGLCVMLGGRALLCNQQKNDCLRWSHNACHENCHVAPNTSAGTIALGCSQVLWLSVPHQLFPCLSSGRLHPCWAIGGWAIFMGASTMNQLERITKIMGTLTQVDLDATQFSFHFFFCLFAL